MAQPVERFPGLPVARTSDLDEARESATVGFRPHDLRVVDHSTALDMRLNAVRSGPVTAGFLRYGPDLWMRTAEADNYHVNVPLSGVATSRSGRRDRVVAAVDRAAVFMPGAPAEIHWGAGSAQLCLMLARDVVDRELERLLGRELTRGGPRRPQSARGPPRGSPHPRQRSWPLDRGCSTPATPARPTLAGARPRAPRTSATRSRWPPRRRGHVRSAAPRSCCMPTPTRSGRRPRWPLPSR